MVEKKRAFIIKFVYALIMIGIAFVVLKFSFTYLMPFIIGFVIAFVLKPIIEFLTKKFGERKYMSLLVIVIFYIILGTLLVWLFFSSIASVQNLLKLLPGFYSQSIEPAVEDITIWVASLFKNVDEGIADFALQFLDTSFDALKSFINSASSVTLSFLTRFVGSVPSLLISILISIISSFFFTLDYRIIVNSLMNNIPEKQRVLILDIRSGFVKILGKYLRAYATLMSLTFVELSIAFMILGLGNPFGLAFLIACVDILPVLGTGSVMIPWGVWQVAVGNRSLGLALLVVYIIITVIRNVLEPKVVGDQIGLHPLVTLICIYVGLKLFGFMGLLGLPIFVTMIKSLHDEGKIDVFNSLFTSEEV